MKRPYHFYIASLHTWVTAKDLSDAFIKFCNHTHDEETPIVIAQIPLPMDSNYQIQWFLPKIENTEYIYLCESFFNTNEQLSPLALTHLEMLNQLDFALEVKAYVS